MQDGYKFEQPRTVDETYDVLKYVATKTKSILQFRPGIIYDFNLVEGQGKVWADKPNGSFQSPDWTPSSVTFILERAMESEDLCMPRCSGVQFDKFELQEFNEGGQLSQRVNELVAILDEAYKSQ